MALLTTWGIPIAVSVVLAFFQGGYITGGFMSVISSLTGRSYPMVTTDFQGFSLRWPPAVPSGHFGPLSLFDPGQIVIMVAEAGLALILLPVAVIYWLRKLRLLAIGMTMVILTGGIDLSVGSLIALAAVVTTRADPGPGGRRGGLDRRHDPLLPGRGRPVRPDRAALGD